MLWREACPLLCGSLPASPPPPQSVPGAEVQPWRTGPQILACGKGGGEHRSRPGCRNPGPSDATFTLVATVPPRVNSVLALFFVFSLKPELPTQKQVLRQRKAGPGISSQRTSLERVGPGRPWGPGRAVGENAPKERSRAWELPGAGQAPKPN